jgi:hypothetical protein
MVTKRQINNRIEYSNEKGLLHRLDGPAREFLDGDKYWYINGILHREDGPAIEGKNGYKSWYLNGIYYLEQEWQQEVIKIKLERLKSYGN